MLDIPQEILDDQKMVELKKEQKAETLSGSWSELKYLFLLVSNY